MGLLSKLARKGGNFMGGAADSIARRLDPLNWTDSRSQPASNAIMGGLMGGLGGAGANPDDPLSGALAGAGLGAVGGAGLSVAKLGAGGLMGGAKRLAALDDISVTEVAASIKAIAREQGPAAAEDALMAMKSDNPTLFEQVLRVLPAVSDGPPPFQGPNTQARMFAPRREWGGGGQ